MARNAWNTCSETEDSMFYLDRIRAFSNYSASMLKDDFFSGLTVSLISLPLAMAFAIAIGVSPQYGLFAAIIAGAIQAIFGGSESNISGPAGAFIGALTAFTAAGHDYNDVLVVGILAGAILIVASLLRIGKIIQFVPYPVILGFTGGIGIIILKTQIAAATGIDLNNAMEIFTRWNELDFATFGITVFTILVIELFARFVPKLPSALTGIIFSGLLVYILQLDIATVESTYGAIPGSLPSISIPDFLTIEWRAFLPVAFSIAALAALETLLSATASDKMTGKRHHPNAELFGCGLANIGSALFGGIPVCGAIARTTLNAKSGSRTWVAALFNALSLLMMVLIAAPLVGKTPLAALAGVLIGISFKLIHVKLYYKLLKSVHFADFAMVMVTLLLTIFVDLSVGILFGLGIAVITYFVRFQPSKNQDNHQEQEDGTLNLNVSNSLYFGNARKTALALSNTDADRVEIRFSEGLLFDSTGVEALKDIKAANQDIPVVLKGVTPKLRLALDELGVSSLYEADEIQPAA